jgi:hypothetical protein
MDPDNELRAEMSRRREVAEAAARGERRTAQEKAAYEDDVEEVRARLYETARSAVQALVDCDEPPTSVEVKPKPARNLLDLFFGRPVSVDGWKVRWGGKEAVVCPDGTLFTKFRPGDYSRTSLNQMIDKRLADVGTYREEVVGTRFERAFEGRGSQAEVESIRSDLDRARGDVSRDLADLLRDRGLSL